MKLYVSEELLSLHRKFYITDELGNNLYYISSKIISIGDQTKIYDLNNHELIFIEQELFHLTPHYNIYIKGNYSFTIKKDISIFANNYTLSNDYKVYGDFLMLNFDIYDNNDKEIGTISKKFISIGDKYEIEISNKKNLLVSLAIIVAIANDVNRNQAD